METLPDPTRPRKPIPTALALAAFRRDLADEGIPVDLSDDLVRRAATELLGNGPLILQKADDDGRCRLCDLPQDVCRSAQGEDTLRG